MYRLRRVISILLPLVVFISVIVVAIDEKQLTPVAFALIILSLVGSIEGISIVWQWATPTKRSSPISPELYNQGILNRNEKRTEIIPQLVGEIETQYEFDNQIDGNLGKLLNLSESLRSFVLVGQTGAGKTMILNEILVHHAAGYGKSHHYLPLGIHLSKIDKSQDVLKTIESWWHDFHNINGDFQTFINNRLVQFVLDGLNEIPGSSVDHRRFVQSIKQMIEANPDTPIIISCRASDSIYYEKLGLPIVRIPPLTKKQIQTYVKDLDMGQTFWKILKKNKLALEMAKNPHTLLLLLDFYKGTQRVPNDSKTLYQTIIAQRYEKHLESKIVKVPQSVFLFFMRKFALNTLLDDRIAVSQNKARYLLPFDILKIAVDLQLLNIEDAQVAFSHSIFQDYFAIEELSRRLKYPSRSIISWILLIAAIILLVVSIFPINQLFGIPQSMLQFVNNNALLASLILLYTSRLIFDDSTAKFIKQQRKRDSVANVRQVDLFSALSKSNNEYTRARATYILGETQSIDAMPALVKRLEDESAFIRHRAVDALSKIVHPDVVNHIHSALNDSYPIVRFRAAYALMCIGDKTSIELLQTLLNDSDKDVAGQAQRSLGQIQDLHHRKWRVRKRTVAVAGRQGQKAIPQLIQALEDYEEEVQYEAARALAKIGKASIPALLDQLKAPERRRAASTSLYLIGKKALPALKSALEDEQFDNSYIQPIIERIETDQQSGVYKASRIDHIIQILDDEQVSNSNDESQTDSDQSEEESKEQRK